MIGAVAAQTVEIPDRRAVAESRLRKASTMTLRTAPAALSSAEAASLIRRIAETQDRGAFAALFAYYFPRVKAYMLRVGASPASAEEFAQEALLRVWRKADSFDPRAAAASTWIFVIARNLRIDRLRGERNIDGLESDPSEEPDAPQSGEAIAIMNERRSRLHAALAALPAEQAHIIELFYFEEHPHSEIARMLGVPLGTVKSRVRLAVQRLRAELEDLGS
ncbi:sigma-70 family RNA polymerase sigma factor [Methylocystis sp. L43]|jgi:RNA polymerase sigma-70 factor (ECF subfamily)|nr:sigma-70 family RNA polymerase sigma factor [Methylocystis sp. L43]MBG0807323.1 sigma-70 family RNA polymerase sigma factor [Methylocystis sp. H15]